jgi:hypothetical protein
MGLPGPTVPEDQGPYFEATVDMLPNEILELIFMFYLGLDDPHFYYPTVHDPLNPYAPSQLFLTAVSARWRALMLSTPKLWSHIGFDLGKFTNLNEKQRSCYAKRVDILLHHSKDYPLNVFISMRVKYYQYQVHELGCIIVETLFAQSPRWRSVTLQIGRGIELSCEENPSRKLSIHWPSSFPQLETLEIDHHDTSTISSVLIDQYGSAFHKTPSLKCLKIIHFWFQDFRYLQFPFSQIRTLMLPSDWSRQAVLQTLQDVSQLDYLRFTLRNDSVKFESLAAPMKVFCRELVVTVFNEAKGRRGFPGSNFSSTPGLEISHFFERVQFVGTTSMALDSYEAHWTAAQIQGLLYSIQTSMSDLTYLSLENLVFGEEDIVLLLPLLPSLHTLRILEQPLEDDYYPTAREAFFRALTVPQANSAEDVDSSTLDAVPITIIPQLRELELEIGNPDFMFLDLLVDMVLSRPRLRLLKVKSEAPDNCNMESIPEIVEGMVEDLKLGLSCRTDLCIQGSSFGYEFDLELESIHRR